MKIIVSENQDVLYRTEKPVKGTFSVSVRGQVINCDDQIS